jgi:hypothetical protein
MALPSLEKRLEARGQVAFCLSTPSLTPQPTKEESMRIRKRF